MMHKYNMLRANGTAQLVASRTRNPSSPPTFLASCQAGDHDPLSLQRQLIVLLTFRASCAVRLVTCFCSACTVACSSALGLEASMMAARELGGTRALRAWLRDATYKHTWNHMEQTLMSKSSCSLSAQSQEGQGRVWLREDLNPTYGARRSCL
jgi:hypothetical protein